MILVDSREKPNSRDKAELVDLIRRYGIKSEKTDLPYGDFAFDGLDDKGPIAVGVERKRLHDMLNCIDDSRLVSFQRLGMRKLYRESWLLIEGVWRPHDPKGLLMESRDGCKYWECKPNGRAVLYSKLRRYLFSVARSGSFVDILYCRDMAHTAWDLCELYRYYQKREHTSLLELRKPNIAKLNVTPNLRDRWLDAIDGIGPKKRQLAARIFKTARDLGASEVEEWTCVPGVGEGLARSIVDQIEGKKR